MPRLRDGGVSEHPNTDLRAVHHVPDVDPVELAELRHVRRKGRPSLTQIAAACRTYHEGGSVEPLRQVLGMAEDAPQK